VTNLVSFFGRGVLEEHGHLPSKFCLPPPGFASHSYDPSFAPPSSDPCFCWSSRSNGIGFATAGPNYVSER
jgi:hypothetical protein